MSCAHCNGTGRVHSHNDECWECEGSGIAGEAARRRIRRQQTADKGVVIVSYQKERDEFIARITREGLGVDKARALLRYATTLNRLAELACSSEEADRDRITCPRKTAEKLGYATKPIKQAIAMADKYPCLCDRPTEGHEDIPRIRLQDWRTEQLAIKAVPAGWGVITEGDPRGYTLRVIPPSYAERNAGKDRFNLDAIGVPSGPSGLRF